MPWQKSLITFILIVVTKTRSFKLEDMLCTDEFCTEYIKEKGCRPLTEACLAQNSTHNGVYLPFADVCNCCDFCLSNLAEGDPCVIGIASMLPPTTICGPGLACTKKDGSSTCQPMKTDCTKAQMAWDDRRANGVLGMTEVRPKCDDDGLYAPAHCIPGSICYCVDEEGKRIFGEMPFLNPWDEHKMTCGCSINYEKARTVVEPEYAAVMLAARCTDYGLFETLQCVGGSEGNCLCVDPITGDPKDGPIVPVFNITKGKPSCFDPLINNPGVYDSECEMMKIKWFEESITTTTTEASVRENAFDSPECQPDGKYHRVQTLGTRKICVYPSGEQIGNYGADLQSPEAQAMRCNCARTEWVLAKAGVTELPTCCSDGSFVRWQCRRDQCFCVDGNGDQIGVEVNRNDITKLSCYDTNRPCIP